MSKTSANPLHQVADFYSACQKVLDPEERTKAFAEWMGKQPPNVQRMVADSLPALANIGKTIRERRIPRMPGDPNAR
jgi:hypothetical protein